MRVRLGAALVLGCAVIMASGAGTARAAPIIGVQVGYADSLRPNGFFPNPWQGSPNTVFIGNDQGAGFDAGAIRIDNLTGAPITINDVTAVIRPSSNPGATTFDLWGSNVLLPGQTLILTETANDNFDTSDQGAITPVGKPVRGGPDSPTVTITVNGIVLPVFKDTGHVLDTGGFDFAAIGNESFAWRPIGGAGGQSGAAPEPASLTLLGIGAAGMIGYGWRRRKLAPGS
jgi:hypothetical protein